MGRFFSYMLFLHNITLSHKNVCWKHTPQTAKTTGGKQPHEKAGDAPQARA